MSELRVLIVEDNDEKYRTVRSLISAGASGLTVGFTHAREYAEAIKTLSETSYDVVILDLVLPAGAYGVPNKDNSRSLVASILSGATFAPAHVVGLTAYLDVAEEERDFYQENMFALEVYSETNTSWAERISAKLRYLAKSKDAALHYSLNNFFYDAVILCARYENEFKPIVEQVHWVVEPVRRSAFFPHNHCAIGRMRVSTDRALEVVFLCMEQMGMAPAAAIASNAITAFRPKLMCMLGMCCGFHTERCSSPSNAGDIIIARETACWEEGRYTTLRDSSEEFRNRAIFRSIDPDLHPRIQQGVENASDVVIPYLRKQYSSRRARRLFEEFGLPEGHLPSIKYGLLVSGSSVVASAQQVEEVLERFPNALGLEMEMFGVYTAAVTSLGRRPNVLGIKGVADFGNGAKHKRLQAFASVAALRTLEALLFQLQS